MNSKVDGELDQMLEVVVVMLVGVVELMMVVMEVVLDKEVGKKVVVGVGQDQGRYIELKNYKSMQIYLNS